MYRRKRLIARKFAFITFFICFLFASGVFAESGKKIIVLPFDVHSKSGIPELRKQMLRSVESHVRKRGDVIVLPEETYERFAAEAKITPDTARITGQESGADFVIVGSLSLLGNLFSADVSIIDIRNDISFSGIYAQGSGPESIDSIAEELSRAILLTVVREDRIADIRFSGNQRIEDSAIRNILAGQKGELFSGDTLSSDIKTIYKMGYFIDVAA